MQQPASGGHCISLARQADPAEHTRDAAMAMAGRTGAEHSWAGSSCRVQRVMQRRAAAGSHGQAGSSHVGVVPDVQAELLCYDWQLVVPSLVRQVSAGQDLWSGRRTETPRAAATISSAQAAHRRRGHSQAAAACSSVQATQLSPVMVQHHCREHSVVPGLQWPNR